MKIDYLKKWPIIFKDEKQEELFRLKNLSEDTKRMAIFKGVMSFLIALFIRNDYLFFSFSLQFQIHLLLRLIIIAWSVGSLFYLFRNRNVSFFDRESITWSFVLIFFVIYVNSVRPNTFFLNAMIDIFLVFTLYILLPLRTDIKLYMCLSYSLINCLIFLFLRRGVAYTELNTILISYIASNTIGFLGAIRIESFRRVQFKAFQDEKKHKKEIELYVEQLEEVNRDLDSYNHTVAHDLKTPISGIIGNLDLLQEELDEISQDNSEVRRHIEEIISSSYNLIKIIDELLLLATVSKNDEIEITSIDMKEILSNVLLRFEHEIKKYNVTVKISDQLKNSIGYGPWIEEVWANYISNAIKYGGNPPAIEIGCSESGDGYIKYWIKDNGNGVKLKHQSELFNEFTKLAKEDRKSHGLGLSIVKRIVGKLNGEYGVENTGKEGATFFFSLPI